MKILDIRALQILDSRGNPTLRVEVVLEDGSAGIFDVPSGASKGIHEAHELRDQDEKKYHGKSVTKAIKNIYKLRTILLDKDFIQSTLDKTMIDIDRSKNKGRIGANAILGISIAFAKASAKYFNIPLYEYLQSLTKTHHPSKNKKTLTESENIHLFANVINGGLHAGSGLNIQEFMIIPVIDNINEKIRAISEIYQTLKNLIETKYGRNNTGVGDEGGFAPQIDKTEEALDLLVEAINETGYKDKVYLALDCAASDFYDNKTGLYEVENGLRLDHKKLTKFYNNLFAKYPIISIEDPMAEDDFEGFSHLRKNIKKIKIENPLINEKRIIIVGDDLLVTNPERIKIAVKKKLCNALLLKINQIGTLTESIEAFTLAKKAKWHTIVSHRSGETTDSFISDLAVALSSSIKLGAPARGERVAKYNRLLEIFAK